jgi:hypothetical protein
MLKEKISVLPFFDSLKDKSLPPTREKPPFNDFATNSQKVFNRCQTFNLKPSHFYYMTEGNYKLFMARRGSDENEQYHLYLSNEKQKGIYHFAAILEPNKVATILSNSKKDVATTEDIKNINKCLTILERTTPLYGGSFDE